MLLLPMAAAPAEGCYFCRRLLLLSTAAAPTDSCCSYGCYSSWQLLLLYGSHLPLLSWLLLLLPLLALSFFPPRPFFSSLLVPSSSC